MSSRISDQIREVVGAVQRLLDGEISYDAYTEMVPEDPSDDDVAELLDLIEHMPKRRGSLGVSDENYEGYRSKIDHALEKLRMRLDRHR